MSDEKQQDAKDDAQSKDTITVAEKPTGTSKDTITIAEKPESPE